MTTTLKEFLQHTRLGESQCFRNVAVFPIYQTADGSSPYLTLEEALGDKLLTVTEVSESGSVPQLKVNNLAEQPVLLLDGEELLGAKQNRVLNATILLREKSETVIPVSCTEQGRWAYNSAAFHSSDAIMAHKLRAYKLGSVSAGLAAGAHFESDQAEIWMHTAALHAKARVRSDTGAMHDVFLARKADLETGLKVLELNPGQSGLLVVVDGEVAGFDILSLPRAYTRLHSKLVRSYILDALLEQDPKPANPDQARQKAQEFLTETGDAEEKRFESVGYGHDLRIKGKSLAGTVLVHTDKVIHAACFRLPADEQGPRMASVKWRRRSFMG